MFAIGKNRGLSDRKLIEHLKGSSQYQLFCCIFLGPEKLDVKLLWECVDWLYGQMKLTCKNLKLPTPRTKYLQQKEKYFTYMRMRKKHLSLTVKRTRNLLHLLDKLLRLQEKIEDQQRIWVKFPEKFYTKKRVIRKVLTQQKQMFQTKKTVPDRVVSIAKSYVRPII